ncbi:MAG: V-type ATP synthase subunit E family protein [Promethearchaeota archaeon]
MVERAQLEISEIHKQTLFQKAKIRKKNTEQGNNSSMKIRQSFVEAYNQFLNTQITTVLLKAKERILSLKNSLLKDFKVTLLDSIKARIKKNYSHYIDFLLNYIKNISKNIDSPPEIIILFNSNDYKYFIKNSEKIEKLFKNKVIIKEDSSGFIGGFKISRKNAIVSYDYTINHLINLQKTLIEMQFSNLITDDEYKKLENEFEKLINDKKRNIEEYLSKYDQIE